MLLEGKAVMVAFRAGRVAVVTALSIGLGAVTAGATNLTLELAPLERSYNGDSGNASDFSTTIPLDLASKFSSIQGADLHLVGQGTSRTLAQGQLGCPFSAGCPESSQFEGALGRSGFGFSLFANFPHLSGPFDLEMPFHGIVAPCDFSCLLEPGAELLFRLVPQSVPNPPFPTVPAAPGTIDQAFLVVTGTPVPEPGALVLAVPGLATLALKRRSPPQGS